MSITPRLADVIRERLAERSMTQWQLGQALGMSESSLSQRVTGRTAWDLEDLVRVADVLDIPLSDLIAAAEAAALAEAAS